MGNTLGQPRFEDLRSYLLDSPDIVVHSLLATYKLFKVFHCAHEGYKHGGVIVKLFIPNVPEEDDLNDGGIRVESVLKPYRDATFLVQCRIWGLIHPNVVPYESAEISSHSGLLLRQYFGRNLFDRMYSQPRLTRMHQQWFALQLLCAVAQLHSVGIIHGDIKLENVFVVGSFQAILTDLATFIKPVYLPLDDPVAATSQFFESGVKRRRCFIAPERFIDSLTSRVLDEHGRRMTFFDKEFTTEFVKMDLFSAGSAIAEMYLEGQHIVDLPELLAFRSGGFDLGSVLEKIPDESVRNLVLKMTARDPKLRPSRAMDCVELFLNTCPPEFESLLIPLLAVTSHPIYANADMRVMLLRRNWKFIHPEAEITAFEPLTELEIFEHSLHTAVVSRGLTSAIQPLMSWAQRVKSGISDSTVFPHPLLSSRACHDFSKKIFQIWRDGTEANLAGASSAFTESISHRINELYSGLFENHTEQSHDILSEKNRSQVGTILASLLGSTLTACTWSVSKIICLEMMESLTLPDECVSDYLIPYVHDVLLHAATPAVKLRAMECLAVLVKRLNKAETGLFSEYLFPLCLQVDLPAVVKLAAALTQQAVRLSKPDEGGKKLAAIKVFSERFLVNTVLSEKHEIDTEWRKSMFEAVEIFELVSEDLLVREVELCLMLADVRDSVLKAVPRIIGIVQKKARIAELLLSEIELESPHTLLLLIQALAAVLRQIFNDKSTTVELVKKLVSFLGHPVPLVREAATHALVHDAGSVLSPVDQFVFLRHTLPKGCRTLLDLVLARRPLENKYLFSKNILRPSNVERGVSESTLRTASPPLGASHILPVHIVNKHFTAPRQSDPGKENGVINDLSLRRWKDWRFQATDTPLSLPDLGCLSGMDGSLVSLYEEDSSGTMNLQKAYLSTQPCVPLSSKATAPFSQAGVWKPESLLLATLNDFCSSGFAVPVVAVDATDDGRIIAAAGADGTVRLWRTNALETESVLQSTRVLKIPDCQRLYALKTLRNTKSVVVGNDSRLLVYRVDAAMSGGSMSNSARLGELPLVQSDEFTGGHVLAVDYFDTNTYSCVLAACEKGDVIAWDLRSNTISSQMKLNPTNDLVPSSLVTFKNGHGFAVSTLASNVIVYDMRFLKPVSTFSHSTGPISRMTASASQGCVWISAGSEVGFFDIANGGAAKQMLAVNQNGTVPNALPSLIPGTPASAETSLTKLIKSDSNARCIIECSFGSNFTVISGHNDGVVRHWNPAEKTAGVAFPLQLEPTPTDHCDNGMAQLSIPSTDGVPASLPNVAGRPCTVTEGHRDAVLDICVASLQYDIVVTAGRDGLIKLWK